MHDALTELAATSRPAVAEVSSPCGESNCAGIVGRFVAIALVAIALGSFAFLLLGRALKRQLES